MFDATLNTALFAYISYLGTGFILVILFAWIYLIITPLDEIKLIQAGFVAPALSFGGALIGFCMALASSALHTNRLEYFVLWAVLAGVVQIGVFYAISFFVTPSNPKGDNIATGVLLGASSIAVGLLNAGCLS